MAGVAREINNLLAIIYENAALIKERFTFRQKYACDIRFAQRKAQRNTTWFYTDTDRVFMVKLNEVFQLQGEQG